jgi:hypothetical protein
MDLDHIKGAGASTDDLFVNTEYEPYVSPVHPKHFMRVAGVFILAAFIVFSQFLVYQLNYKKAQRSLVRELLLAIVGSLFTGFGTIFTFMWLGNYL